MLEQNCVDACDYWDSYPHNAYYQPLSKPDSSIQDLALAKCILCKNYFWIDEGITTGWDIFPDDDDIPLNCAFTKIYEPWGHQPAVYSCDAPDSFCPVCLSGKGPLEKCASCGKYHFPFDETWFGEWDDPLITLDEVKELCAECVDYLRIVRSSGGMS